jgi:NAD(P)-dependent dehydrogenase (short-subunit alcohol dehydrogenase family)
MGRLDGKIAIVTGTGPNIGSGLAVGLAKEGAMVACNDIRVEQVEKALGRIRQAGGEGLAIPGDVTDEESVKANVQKVLDAYGKIDILVNSAAILGGKGVLDYDLKDFQRQVQVILSGTFLYTKYVAQAMIDLNIQGSIICILSTAAWQGQPGNVGYCTAKGGLINFVRSTAMELAQYGIRVNGFTPTATQPDNPEVIEQRRQQTATPGRSRVGGFTSEFTRMVPMGELPTPTDYAYAVVFLASDEARLITGTDIKVDGGATAKYWPWIPPERRDAGY